MVIDPQSRDLTAEYLRRGMSSPDSRPFYETRILRPDGDVRELEVRAGPVYRQGRLVGRQGVGRDITELKRLQNEVVDKSSRLALMESQQRAATDLYRRLSPLVGDLSARPEERAAYSMRLSAP